MRRNTTIILFLCVCVVALTIGYAAFSQNIDINTNVTLESSWDVKFSSIVKSASTGSAYEVESPSFTDNIARFNVGFLYKDDSITYDVTVQNNGTIYAKVDAITPTTTGSTAIAFTNTATNGICINPGESYTFTVTAAYTNPANLTQDNRVGRLLLTLGVRQSNSSCS